MGVWLKKACFGSLSQKIDGIAKPAEFTSADCGFMWRVKDKMEVATEVTWTKSEWGSKSVAVERILTEGILRDIRGRQTLFGMQLFNQKLSSPTQ